MPWDNRGKRSDEQLEIFERLFRDETPLLSWRILLISRVRFEPKPIQQPVPVWVGGNSKAAFQRTARFGEGFHAAFEPLSKVEEEWNQIKVECEKSWSHPGEITLSLRMFLDPNEMMETAKSIGGSANQMVDTIGRVQDIGVSHILVDPVA